MGLDWLDAFLISGTFGVVEIIGLGLLLHLQVGLTRVANFGVVGFWGLGLYTFGVLYVRVDWPFGDPWQFLLSALGAMIAAGLAGLLIAWLVADLDSDGALVGTLGFASVVLILATTQGDLTGGALGLGGLGFPYDVGSTKANELVWLGVMTLVVAAIFAYVRWVHRTPYGRLLIAVGANEPLARSLGKSTTAAKLGLFTITCGLMGLLGALHGVMVRFLDIGSLDVGVTLAALAGLILGGAARVWGAVVGVLLTVGLFDIVIQFYIPLPQEWYTQAIPVLREAVFGAVVVAILLFRPQGLLGEMRRPRLMRSLHDFD
ncbi:MAG: branched-chain amino acid ABC transporter permease [Actinomycetota bacterium]